MKRENHVGSLVHGGHDELGGDRIDASRGRRTVANCLTGRDVDVRRRCTVTIAAEEGELPDRPVPRDQEDLVVRLVDHHRRRHPRVGSFASSYGHKRRARPVVVADVEAWLTHRACVSRRNENLQVGCVERHSWPLTPARARPTSSRNVRVGLRRAVGVGREQRETASIGVVHSHRDHLATPRLIHRPCVLSTVGALAGRDVCRRTNPRECCAVGEEQSIRVCPVRRHNVRHAPRNKQAWVRPTPSSRGHHNPHEPHRQRPSRNKRNKPQ